ncbi:MAG: hypothetical protein J7527_03640 [Chitinophagaceae bacterium]|nr:hypothetical protein [Chitinophagaceae bacterium]
MKRKNFLLLAVFLQLAFLHSFAQTKEQVHASIQKLLNKAVGQKLSSFTGDKKITKQVFSSAEVSLNEKNLNKYGTEWVHRYTDIPWNDFYEHVIFDESSNNKLNMLKMRFKKSFKSEFFTSDKPGDEDARKYNTIELYLLAKDAEAMEEQMKLLYTLREKRPESAFNAKIRAFTKEQTITWLKAKLLEKMEGGQFDQDIRIVSMDECKIKVTYTSLGRKWEADIPTAIQEITDHGVFKYATKIASKKNNSPDMLVDGERTYSEYAAIGIDENDEELMDNIGCAMKHLAGFCKNGSSSR